MNIFSASPMRIRIFLLGALFTGAAALPGCASSGSGGAVVISPQMAGGTEWMLGELEGTPVDAAAADRPPFLTLIDGGRRLAGSGGVNRIGGPVVTEEGSDRVRFGPIIATRMAGSPESMALEQRFLLALERTERLVRIGDTLELRAGDGTVLARFGR